MLLKIKEIQNAAQKQAKALQILNTDQQLKLIGDLFSKNCLTANPKDESENHELLTMINGKHLFDQTLKMI